MLEYVQYSKQYLLVEEAPKEIKHVEAIEESCLWNLRQLCAIWSPHPPPTPRLDSFLKGCRNMSSFCFACYSNTEEIKYWFPGPPISYLDHIVLAFSIRSSTAQHWRFSVGRDPLQSHPSANLLSTAYVKTCYCPLQFVKERCLYWFMQLWISIHAVCLFDGLHTWIG